MFSGRWATGLDEKRLRIFVALFFLALAIPTALLIWQAYSQLKWESFHQHRGFADTLSRRIDARLNELVSREDARSFADYSFIVVAGDPAANFVQRSPLSEFPVAADVPGVIGYFQVDSDGVFSTPILPPLGTDANSLGLGDEEFADRENRAQQIQSVLADNRLVQARPTSAVASSALAAAPAEEVRIRRQAEEAVDEADVYSQQVFDDLNRASRTDTLAKPGSAESEDAGAAGRVGDLQLDAELEEKSRTVVRRNEAPATRAVSSNSVPSRSKRVEQTVLPESVSVQGGAAVLEPLRVSTFESELDPFEFSLLDSGHIVLFRKVWRDRERYIQGLLLDQATFLDETVVAPFSETTLFDMSNLIVAHNDTVIRTASGRLNSSYRDAADTLSGTLLYRQRLSSPLSSLELIFSINELPAGPGARVLSWVTLLLAVIFVGGFLLLYRLGASQIRLARQQQDFVSAVSHELKTPLTSIRMYGEMLKEGWADEGKRQTYYEFIHDESERLSKLIENVLQLSRVTRNDLNLDLKPVEVGALMSNVHSKIASQVERAGFALSMDRDEKADGMSISIDEDCFVQIIINLVDNAIKFSKDADHKCIEIRSQLSADRHVCFSIRDFGPGVARDQMKKIFQRFYRVESELTRETVGTGIGLAIVHQLTLAMDGSVDLVNANPGAEFRVQFPAAV